MLHLKPVLGNRFLCSAGAGGSCAPPMRLPNPSPILDKNREPMSSEILSSTGAGVWRKAPMAFPDSSSVLDTFQSAIFSTSQYRNVTTPGEFRCYIRCRFEFSRQARDTR